MPFCAWYKLFEWIFHWQHLKRHEAGCYIRVLQVRVQFVKE
jgi:hypothetical protein